MQWPILGGLYQMSNMSIQKYALALEFSSKIIDWCRVSDFRGYHSITYKNEEETERPEKPVRIGQVSNKKHAAQKN